MTIHNTSGDPEAIVVNAKPQDVETFLRLSRWLSGLQTELDRSWAVLGEIYGLQSHNNLNLLGLKIRRVKSNMDDVFAFSKTVPYVPARIAFEAENADLLKLLVAPLYSDEPGIGIRELIQNAIDAVREFEDTAARHPDVAMVDRYQQASDVRLDVQCDKDGLPTEVIVTDRGIGMTAEIIRDYFLKAGASFRRSNAWRREHEDSKGHSRVLRTGRFGVGALAAFLLGDEIEVTTRHAFSAPDEGVTFTARLDDEALSLNRVRCPVGTKISIKVPERARKRVSSIVPSSWAKEISYVDDAGHYFLKRPSLSRHFSGRKELPPAGWLPQIEDVVSREWRCFSTPAFEKIFWSYDRNLPSMACNGIVISGGEGSDSLWRYLRVPNISVFDKDGSLPVNLQRTGLQGPLPFRDDLLRSIGEDIAAHALVEGPRNAESGWLFGAYEGLQRGNVYGPAANRDWSKWLIGRDGYILNEPSLVFRFRPALLVIVVGGDADHKSWGEAIRLSLPHSALAILHLPGIFADTNPRIKGVFRSALEGSLVPPDVRVGGYVTYVPRGLIEKVKTLRPGKSVLHHLKRVGAADERGGWRVIEERSVQLSGVTEAVTALPAESANPVVICVAEVKAWDAKTGATPLADRWMEVLGTPIVPFDLKRRQELEAEALTQIAGLLQVRRAVAAEKDKKGRVIRDAADDDEDPDEIEGSPGS